MPPGPSFLPPTLSLSHTAFLPPPPLTQLTHPSCRLSIRPSFPPSLRGFEPPPSRPLSLRFVYCLTTNLQEPSFLQTKLSSERGMEDWR
ncbi:hypothetical protein E2C01_079811 [Portunus trituberculatus]|uniref:Uncharacterized protein n=1 Tax=Portunus trituberculatus TaxID=210409 RepID=A0A5B7IRT2_PORTR|nr:hypothetical protein [Portunus trituberculatus]